MNAVQDSLRGLAALRREGERLQPPLSSDRGRAIFSSETSVAARLLPAVLGNGGLRHSGTIVYPPTRAYSDLNEWREVPL